MPPPGGYIYIYACIPLVLLVCCSRLSRPEDSSEHLLRQDETAIADGRSNGQTQSNLDQACPVGRHTVVNRLSNRAGIILAACPIGQALSKG